VEGERESLPPLRELRLRREGCSAIDGRVNANGLAGGLTTGAGET